MIHALCRKLVLRKKEIEQQVETIYFGGGTPSLLEDQDLRQIFRVLYENFDIAENAEITLEANPDDLSAPRLKKMADVGINRLSIGVQSFFEEDLKLMNRAHNAKEALESVQEAMHYFKNISIDLIYGIPGMDHHRWHKNLEIALELQVPHLSAYALTVENGTALKTLIEKGKISPVEEDLAREHYDILTAVLTAAGYENYEFSNFGKPGFHSRNNTGYWFGKPYLGIGPSAHSYIRGVRFWNVSHNTHYIKALEEDTLPLEREELSPESQYNELIMTRLRTRWGVNPAEVKEKFGSGLHRHLLKEAAPLLKQHKLIWSEGHLKIAPEARFLGDGIAAALFFVD